MPVEGSYLTLVEFVVRTVMPSEDVYELETRAPGFILARLTVWTSKINARLRKRYAVPFDAPVNEIVLGWLAAIVTVEAYQKRGWNAADEQAAQIKADRDEAIAELKEAADSQAGLFDLPLRQNTTADGISRGGPLASSDASPYALLDAEALRGS